MQVGQEQQRKQAVSQETIRSDTILQMSAEELSDYLKEMALENPVIDLKERRVDTKYEERVKKLEWLSGLDEQNRTYYQFEAEDLEDHGLMRDFVREDGETLKHALRQQLLGKGYSKKEMAVFEYITLCLDASGYFTMEVRDLARQLGLSEEECAKYLDIMKNLEPAGICAGSLQECLLKQLEGQEGVELERAVIEGCLELLGNNRLSEIAEKMNVGIDRVRQAKQKIQSLNPKPASGYDSDEYARYIEPDVTVIKFEDRFEILLNDYAYPLVRLNKEYLQMMRSDCPEDAREYLEKKVSQAKQIQGCIANRGNVLMELAKYLIDVQKEFFLSGEKSLCQISARDAARRLSMPEAAISKAVRNKYLQCCWGIYPLRFFFAREYGGGGISQPA